MGRVAIASAYAACHHEILTVDVTVISEIYIGTIGIEMTRVNATERFYEFRHHRNFTPQFIAKRKHHERRMIAILLLYSLTVIKQKLHQLLGVLGEYTPYRKLGLQVYAFHVGSLKTGFGRTPRVKTHVI